MGHKYPEKVHLDFNQPITPASLQRPPLTLKEKRPAVTPTCLLSFGKDFTNWRKQPGISCWVRVVFVQLGFDRYRPLCRVHESRGNVQTEPISAYWLCSIPLRCAGKGAID